MDEVIWNQWLVEIQNIKFVKIPRCINPFGIQVQSVELHMFSDASQVGYGAAGYLRLVSHAGAVHCCLLMGKSRVTPLKSVTIPRLELTAAVLSTKLMNHLIDETMLTLSLIHISEPTRL
jgi:hypothetical protein